MLAQRSLSANAVKTSQKSQDNQQLARFQRVRHFILSFGLGKLTSNRLVCKTKGAKFLRHPYKRQCLEVARSEIKPRPPDGKWILISSDLQTPGRVALFLFPLDAAPHAESQTRVLASNPDYNLWQGRFSPDGRWISFNAFNATDPTASTIYLVSSSGGEWISLTEGRYWDDKPRWSPDGKAIYFVSNRIGLFNVWKMRIDPATGKPLDHPARVTDFESPTQMIIPNIVPLEIALTSDRIILPMMESSGGIWILENVDP